MRINIWNKQDLDLVKELLKEVISTITQTIDILDENYGTERTVSDLGGYLTVVDRFGLEELKQTYLSFIYPILVKFALTCDTVHHYLFYKLYKLVQVI